MGVFITLLLFISVKNMATTSDPVSPKSLQTPELVTSSLKYSAQEFHLPSHALYTITPQAVPTKPSKVIYIESPPALREFITQTNNILTPEHLNSPVTPTLRENTEGLKTTPNPQVFKERTYNTPTPNFKKPEENSRPPIITTENNPKDRRIPYLPTLQPRSQIKSEPMKSPVVYINQNQLNIIDSHNIPQMPQYREECNDENQNIKEYSNTGNAMCTKFVNKNPNLPEKVVPNTPSVFRERIQIANPKSASGFPCQSEKSLERPAFINYQTVPPNDYIVDAVSDKPQSKVTKDSKSINKDDQNIINNIDELLLKYGIVAQRGPNTSKMTYNRAPEIKNNQHKALLYPSADTITNSDNVNQKDLLPSNIKDGKMASIKDPIKSIEQNILMPQSPCYITDLPSNTLENNSPRYENDKFNEIDYNAPNEGVIEIQRQTPSTKPVIQKQINYNNEEGKGFLDISKIKSDNEDIKNQIEKIKRKFNSISTSVQTLPNKQNIDSGITNNVSNKNSLDTGNSIPTSPTICNNNIDKLNNERFIKSTDNIKQNPQTNFRRSERIDNQERIIMSEVNELPYSLNRDFNYNLKATPHYNVHGNHLYQQIPPIHTKLQNYTGQINYANEKTADTKDFHNEVRTPYDVNILNKQIYDILQSENIKEIINDAVRKSLGQIEVGEKGVVPNITQSSIDPKTKPCRNHVNSEVTNKALSNSKDISRQLDNNKRIIENTRIDSPCSVSTTNFNNMMDYEIQQRSPLPYYYPSSHNYASFEILPLPVEPMVIKAPDSHTGSLSDKLIKSQPRVYTKVSSSPPENFATIKPNCNHVPEPAIIQNYPEVYLPRYTSKDSNYQCNPSTLDAVAFEPMDASKLAAATPVVIPNQTIARPTQFPVTPNDNYSALISSSLNNIASVIVTNLLSSINTNVVRNVNSSRQFVSSLPTLPYELTDTPSISHTSPSLDIPIFEVTPPCVESPRYLPDPATVNNTSSDVNPTSNNTKHKHKSSKKESCVSTITINVLPSVQQTSNDIIILV